MRIYLAGPISGKGYDEVVSHYKQKSELLVGWGYEVLCPMTGKSYLRNGIELRAEGYGFPVSTNHAIFERDKWMVGNSDIVFADLYTSGDRVSIGTMMEMAWAALLGKHCIAVIPEGNIHRHAFALEAADIVFETEQEAYDYLADLIRGV
jgi:nucleoside 2-deoxyribosyltransferase